MKIALENNLSETAFAVKEGEYYGLRWFTPGGEIDLCGHATLAAAFVLLRFCEKEADSISFQTLSGILTVKRRGDLYEMKFPAYRLKSVPVTDEMENALGVRPAEAYIGRDLLCVFDAPEAITKMEPDMSKAESLPGLLLHVTARGTKTDCISRSFAPKMKIPEDPVCGSGHCHIAPYWGKRLKKAQLVAYQASKRGGTLYCRMEGEHVYLAGKAALFSEGNIHFLVRENSCQEK